MPVQKRKQLSFTLEKFYHNPVAMVSFELFLSIGAILFFAVFAIRPTLLTMSDLLKEIEDKRTLDKQLVQKIAALSTAQSLYLNSQEKLYVLDEAIPTNPDLLYSLKIIEKIASDEGLVINQLGVTEIPDEKETDLTFAQLKRQNLPITITVNGDYSSIRNFVERLMESRRTFLVESVSFAVEDTRGLKKLSATLTVIAPYFGK